MLQKLENQQKTTVSEIRERYPDNWFKYGLKEDSSVYALYIADTQDELLTVSEDELIADGYINWGNISPKRFDPQYPIEIGGIEIEDIWSKN